MPPTPKSATSWPIFEFFPPSGTEHLVNKKNKKSLYFSAAADKSSSPTMISLGENFFPPGE
jgi:hypothetical protein